MNNQIPYKLSNVIYHLPKLLDSFSAGGLREVKNYFKLNGYDLTIQHYGVETLLDIIMKEICVEGNWNELSYNMEYNNFEKKQLSLFFKNFYNNYANKTLMYQEFFAELLQSNLNDLVETGDIDFRDIANLKNNDDNIYDYEIEINTLDILNKYQEEKSLKGNVEFTLESDDNTYQVEFEYLNNSNQLNLFDIETLDGIVVEFNKNNLEIIKNEIIHQLNMYNELNIEEYKNFEEGDYVTNGRGSSGKIIQIGNSEAEVLVDYDNGPVEPYVCNFYLDELNKVDTEDDGLDEEELENERPFQPEDQNLLLTILDNLDKNFPTPRVEFYYPFENVECSTLMSLEKINNFLTVENEDYESIMVVDDYKLVSLMPDIIEFEDLLRRLFTNIPDSNLENGEDILYMNLSDGTNSIKLKIYISAELHDILAN